MINSNRPNSPVPASADGAANTPAPPEQPPENQLVPVRVEQTNQRMATAAAYIDSEISVMQPVVAEGVLSAGMFANMRATTARQDTSVRSNVMMDVGVGSRIVHTSEGGMNRTQVEARTGLRMISEVTAEGNVQGRSQLAVSLELNNRTLIVEPARRMRHLDNTNINLRDLYLNSGNNSVLPFTAGVRAEAEVAARITAVFDSRQTETGTFIGVAQAAGALMGASLGAQALQLEAGAAMGGMVGQVVGAGLASIINPPRFEVSLAAREYTNASLQTQPVVGLFPPQYEAHVGVMVEGRLSDSEDFQVDSAEQQGEELADLHVNEVQARPAIQFGPQVAQGMDQYRVEDETVPAPPNPFGDGVRRRRNT